MHVIHQLAQAGRTLVAVILNCRNADFRPLISPSIEGLRSCVGLLRRFSGRYLCGLRSADIIDEFCRSKSRSADENRSLIGVLVCNIPVDSPRVPDGTGRPSPAWLRPVRKRQSASLTASRIDYTSPATILDCYPDIMSAPPDQNQAVQQQVTDFEALFNTDRYFDLSAMSPGQPSINTMPTFSPSLTEPFSAYDRQESFLPNPTLGNGDFVDGIGGTGERMGSFDYANGGFGGEMLAGEGMDTVSDGLKGVDGQQGL